MPFVLMVMPNGMVRVAPAPGAARSRDRWNGTLSAGEPA